MARPKKMLNEKDAKSKIEEAFWELLKEESSDQITVSEIVRRVGCNRSTFYYYFESVENLAMQAVERAIPLQIVALAEAYSKGVSGNLELHDDSRKSIEHLCLLVESGSAPELTIRIKQTLINTWKERFHLTKDCEQTDFVLEFMASGILGILSYWGNRPCDVSFDECLVTVSNVFSKPAICFAQEMRNE